MASSTKKARISEDTDILSRFSMETKIVQKLKHALTELSSKAAALVPLSIRQCNAAFGKFGSFGKPFSQADTDVHANLSPADSIFSFGEVFNRGFDMLYSYLDNPNSVPTERHMQLILSRLLSYLLNEDEHNTLRSEYRKTCECDLAVRFAEHFFSKLTASSSYKLDQCYPDSSAFQFCHCGCKKDISLHYGDTSIGNSKTWHGRLDILLNNCELPVTIIEKRSSSGGKSSSEFKVSDNLEDPDTSSQLVAQTIVFSFAQRKQHPEYSHFLIPTIGVSRNKIFFYFYDAEHDILLKSPSHSIFDMATDKLRYFTILATWFVVNYRYLCSGPNEHILNEAKKANFFELADNLLPIYQDKVSVGGVSFERYEENTTKPYEPLNIEDIQFHDPYAI